MEGPNTVDVSWLHHCHRADQLLRTKSTSSVHDKPNGQADPKLEQSGSDKNISQRVANEPPRSTNNSQHKANGTTTDRPQSNTRNAPDKKGANASATPTKGSAPKAVPGRRNSWISTISSKFSTGTTPPGQGAAPQASPTLSSPPIKPDINPFGASFSPKDKDGMSDLANAFTSASSSPKNPSFLQSAFRKLSSGAGVTGKSTNHGGICERRIMNVDPNRDRCKVPELNQGKLKRVAFCVDVEIAGFASREDDEVTRREPTNVPTPQASKLKSKDKSEGPILKHPDAVVPEKVIQPKPGTADQTQPTPAANGDAAADARTKEPPTKKQEKKKRSEEERKERKERKRRLAEENGTIPMQIRQGEDEVPAAPSTAPSGSRSKTQSHPTTDPVRIYRRCCQLRETPVLKKLVEQMTSPSSTLVEAAGTVAVLDLTDFPMTLADIVTFSDWLAIVPVRKLILENCALTDEGVRSILAGLLSTKTMQQARNRRRSTKEKLASVPPPFGVVEKVSLKNNTKIGPEGWRHICLFIHLSKSLKAIDLSGIPFPKKMGGGDGPLKTSDLGTTLANSLTTRFGGDYLEELLLSECQPSTEDIEKICNAAAAVKLRRLGFANNDITHEGLEHVVRYLRSGKCEGIDLGGNDLHEHLNLLADAIDSENPLIALSLADCSLTPASICPLLQAFTTLPNFRFIDFSHNPALFTTQPDCLSMLRKFLPRMAALKRIHLADVDLSPDHAIALAEVLPECPSLAHLNILENPRIASLGSSSDPADQEEACAVYASLMAAVRVSRTLIAVDIEVPGAESNEVVKALASQIVAYSLRNLGALEELSDNSQVQRSEVPIPEVLQHLVGHADPVASTEDEPAPNEDYVIGGTGVVKALGVCLGNLDRQQAEIGGSRSGSGRSTPVPQVTSSLNKTKKARDMSKNLLGSARNIQARIKLALVREDRAGNDANYRRLQFLDQTLQRIIERFEEEFPECRVPTSKQAEETSSQQSSEDSHEPTSALDSVSFYVPDMSTAEDEEPDPFAIRLSRRGSNTSLHSRALTSEEGRLHRISQNLRRDFLNPSLIAPEDGGSVPVDDSHINALREKLENLKGDEKMGNHVESVGAEKAFHELGSTMEELWIIQQQDRDAFERWKESQIAAQINAGLRSHPSQDNQENSSSQPSK
ncbi:cell wall biogenesis protein Mhp1, putative [Talaromyces stipitatus ATCC 10500]|uniref:Cell wall biogenesis protein Mhp1, putative n=1 Tax=Talaromyces stipitatus (strain ATCC 10500 / CBS 375.48 / QM 6759 / NRRL 1006) TaxID=441959 RepID=B8M2C5_TALSN|nr:cell wall biogenesis protein Mhp1, putative [Talaromyces stipitatus ATCC 10500]EED21589.1 cell wall biogenesis protein Mhp1, putative [Talaromyces stipitatus ATCC 10500]